VKNVYILLVPTFFQHADKESSYPVLDVPGTCCLKYVCTILLKSNFKKIIIVFGFLNVFFFNISTAAYTLKLFHSKAH
jgi:hypothetical protein